METHSEQSGVRVDRLTTSSTYSIDTLECLGEVSFDEVFDNGQFNVFGVLEDRQSFDFFSLLHGPHSSLDFPAVFEEDERGMDSNEAVETGNEDGRHCVIVFGAGDARGGAAKSAMYVRKSKYSRQRKRNALPTL